MTTPATPRQLILDAARLDTLVEQQPAHPANGDRILTAQSLRARAEQLAQAIDQPAEEMPAHVAVEAMAEEYAAQVEVKQVARDQRDEWETSPCGLRFRRSALMTVAHVEEAFGKVAARLAAEEGQWPEPAILARQLAAVRRRGQKGRRRTAAGRRYEARARAADLRERGVSY